MKKINYERNDYKNEVKEFKSFDISEIKDDTILSIFDDKATLLKYLKTLEASVNNYQKQLDTLQEQVNTNTTNINNQTQDIVNINGNISSINGNINTLNNSISNINLNITNLDTKSDNLIPMQLWSNDANFNPNNIQPYNKYEWSKLEEGRFIKATTNDNKITKLESEQLPNLKWSATNLGINYNEVSVSGITKSKGGNYGNTNSGNNKTSLSFDAHNVNSVYTDNGKVRPNCIDLVCWLRGAIRSN